jgi:hypothetical protein
MQDACGGRCRAASHPGTRSYVDTIRRLPDDAVVIDRALTRRVVDLDGHAASWPGAPPADVTLPADPLVGDDVP